MVFVQIIEYQICVGLLTKKIQNDSLDTNRLDVDKYWNILEDEERKGGKFMDIAKDIVRTEKGVVFSFMGWTDRDGNLYNSASDIGKFCGLVILIACIYCVVRNEWSVKNFVFGMSGVLVLIAVEGIISIPLYFLSKKSEWVKENRIKALIISMGIVAAVFENNIYDVRGGFGADSAVPVLDKGGGNPRILTENCDVVAVELS